MLFNKMFNSNLKSKTGVKKNIIIKHAFNTPTHIPFNAIYLSNINKIVFRQIQITGRVHYRKVFFYVVDMNITYKISQKFASKLQS